MLSRKKSGCRSSGIRWSVLPRCTARSFRLPEPLKLGPDLVRVRSRRYQLEVLLEELERGRRLALGALSAAPQPRDLPLLIPLVLPLVLALAGPGRAAGRETAGEREWTG